MTRAYTTWLYIPLPITSAKYLNSYTSIRCIEIVQVSLNRVLHYDVAVIDMMMILSAILHRRQ